MPASRFTISCPIDGASLAVVNPTIRGDPMIDGTPGNHLHLNVAFQATCSSGHTWRLSGDLVIERVS